jgi:hypothetical protein
VSEIELPEATKIIILRNKLKLWKNTLYDAQLDARIAKVLEDERNEEQAAQRMKHAHKAIDFLSTLLKSEDDSG